MASASEQTAKMLGMGEYISAYRTKPTDNDPSFQTMLEEIGYRFDRDDKGNLEYFRKEIHPNLPKLSSVLDAYRHAVGSAIEANKRGSVVATGMGIGKEAIDAFKFGKKVITGRSPINKIPTYLEATSGDMYNNRLGRKFSASKNDAMKELNKVFINQLKRMRDEGPNFKFQENVDFKFLDQDY